MKKLFRIASIFLFLASFLGCDIESKPSQDYGSIQGKAFYSNENVSDHSGIQISLISTDGLRAVDYCEARGIATNARKVEDIIFTDSKGNYNFKDVPEGVYTICASSNNSTKKAVLTNVTVTAGRTITASDLGLTATGSISGQITIDGKTDGVLGLDVFIAGTSFIAKVGSDGNYEITNIPAKKGYVLCVQKGEKTKIIAESVEVKGDESSSVGIYDISSDGWISEYIKWLGAYENEPENPALFEAYLNTKDGCLYIWDGTSWDLLGQGGSEDKYNGILNLENFLPEFITIKDTRTYNCYESITKLPYKNQLPNIGDEVTLELEFISNKDINNLTIYFRDHSEAASWCSLVSNEDYGLIERVTAGETIKFSKTFDFIEKPISNVSLNMFYLMTDTDYETDLQILKSNIYVTSEIGLPNYKGADLMPSQISCEVIEDGIKFKGNLLSNVQSSTSTCEIHIKDVDNNVTMVRNYSIDYQVWTEWEMIYPLVEKDKKYNFEVIVFDQASKLYIEEFSIKAIGGLGEYKVENTEEMEVFLSEDKKIISRTPQKFTNNLNVPILDYGTMYTIYSNKDIASSIWDGIWCDERILWSSSAEEEYDLTDLWRYNSIDELLKGRKLGVKIETVIKVAGYTYNGTASFRLNDYKETFFDWDDEEPAKVFVVYGYDLNAYDLGESVYIFDDVPGVEKYYVLENDEGMSFVPKGTKNAKEVYGQFIENGKNIEVPAYIPDFSDSEIDLSAYKFTGEWYSNRWGGMLPYAVVNIITSSYMDEIDGYKYIFVMPEIERIKTLANFYDEDGKTLIDSIECRRNEFGNFSLTLPSAPIKEGFVGYWVDEYGFSINGNSVAVSDPVNNFYLKYKERIFQVDDLYYLNSSVMNFSFNVEAGKAYKIIFADSYEGSSDVSTLINENNISSSSMVDIKVTAYDEFGNYYFTERDSGFNSPYNFYPINSGKLYIDVRPYSSGQGYFALAVKEISDSERFDGCIDLRGKTVMNTEPFAGAWSGGFVTAFDVVNVSEYNELVVEAIFYDEYYNIIEPDWGLGMFHLLIDSAGDWSGDNCLSTQYNLGMQNLDLSTLSGSVTGIAFLTSSDEVKYIQITSIQFVK